MLPFSGGHMALVVLGSITLTILTICGVFSMYLLFRAYTSLIQTLQVLSEASSILNSLYEQQERMLASMNSEEPEESPRIGF